VIPTPFGFVFPSGGYRRAPFLANDPLLIAAVGGFGIPGLRAISGLGFEILQAASRTGCPAGGVLKLAVELSHSFSFGNRHLALAVDGDR
jgi:hypothetical protein